MNRNLLLRTVVLGAMVSVALGAYADTKRPPLPPGSARVKVEPGQSKEENQRMRRAHHDPSDHGKDYTRDETTGTDEVTAPPLPRGSARVRSEPAQTLVANRAEALTPLKALILYDAPPSTEFEKLGFGYAIMLKNLIAHFGTDAELMPVQDYVAGTMTEYDATFYLGAYYDNPMPSALLADMVASEKTVVWFKYNLWKLAWDGQYGFSEKFGFNLVQLRGLNAQPTPQDPAPGFFDTVTYKGMPFVKYYAYDAARNQVNADPDIGVVNIVDPAKASALVDIANPTTGESVPYVLRSGRFWYVADLPFSYIGPRDRYLVLADLLHDVLGVPHATNHRALVRLEDVGAMVSVQAMKTLSDYLSTRNIPYSVAVIPKYVDPLGVYNGGVPQTVPLEEASNLKRSLDYAVARGGEIVMHGYTHQYGDIVNLSSGVSGDDYEFWNMVSNSPVAEDSTEWALARYQAGLADLANNGYGTPVAWETPHYQGSAVDSRATTQAFHTTYQRVVYYTADTPDFNAAVSKDFTLGQVFPYVIGKDYYGQRILPENLGNIEYDISAIDPSSHYTYTWQDVQLNAQYALTVRDGFASFFFHPFWLEPDLGTPGFQDFKRLVDGITSLGYVWTSPSALADPVAATQASAARKREKR